MKHAPAFQKKIISELSWPPGPFDTCFITKHAAPKAPPDPSTHKIGTPDE
jgi:hypothetical protein